ncbi:MAG: tRNA (adenosine(37)-N6)-dimethylallyltransferase MiaA [Henriciella sp.]|nr:tRNA (adenosine(37)-N6)-dimethylallyltransferase MiaA [Henriciella sp.]
MAPAILIHGPTASGKTALSVALAKRLNGEVINADSMQVYRDLRVISARPSENEMEEVPHHLFGHVAAIERYSTGRWLEEASHVIGDVQRRGKVAIVIGGTGLYHLALIEGLSDIPPVPDDVRADVAAISRTGGATALREKLQAVDAETAARFGQGDRQRLARALEVWLATGQSISTFQGRKTRPVLGPDEWLGIALTPPRARLYSRIDKRFEGMLMEGAMEEARGLLAQDLDPEFPAMKAHGMPWLLAFLRQELSAEVAAENAKRDTRRYAKRQFTWIGRQFPFWARVPTMALEGRMRVILALYRELT